ncbi:MAG: type IV pilus biogenesis/stability protein PilW [Gammaproteobacteria bacterium]|nr:type IV pilus biogenesis/stability protein PilW [Gammaproteobacteria bacterium]
MKLIRLLIIQIVLLTLIACTTSSSTRKKPDPVKEANRKSTILVNLGMEYVKRQQYEVAMLEFNKALAINPNSSDAHTAIANLYETIDRPKLAQQHYKQAVELAPDSPSTLNNYGKYLCNQGNYTEAERYFKQAVDTPLYSRPWIPLTNAGQCFLRANQLESAEQNFRAALKKMPAFGPALMAMSQLSYQKKNYQSARAFLQRYESVESLNAEQLSLGIKIEQALGDMDTARKYADTLQKRFPSAPVPPGLSSKIKSQ